MAQEPKIYRLQALAGAAPVINLASLLVLGHEASPRVALGMAAGVWLVACAGGVAVGI